MLTFNFRPLICYSNIVDLKKNIISICFLIVFLSLVFSHQTFSQDVQNFKILSMNADYVLSKNNQQIAQMDVTEKIIAEFPDFDQNHGILRALPLTYDKNNLSLKVTSVTDTNQTPYNYTTYEENDNLILKIGDANTYVRGEISYVIKYTLKNVIKFYDDYSELYWNVNGTQWRQPFGEITVRIFVPASLARSIQNRQICYTGMFGSTEQDCTIERLTEKNGDVLVTVKANNLAATENLSFALAWDKEVFRPDPWPGRIEFIKYTLMFLIPAIVFIYSLRKWEGEGKDPEGGGVIIAQYVPPENLDALSSVVILKQRFDSNAISASIIEMATLGYIKIYEVSKKQLIGSKKEYELELVKSAQDLSEEQKEIIKAIFNDESSIGERVNLSKKSHALYKPAIKLAKDLPNTLTQKGYFNINPSKAISNNLAIGAVTIIAGILVFIISGVVAMWQIGAGLVLSGLIVVIFSTFMPSRSQQGVEANEHLLGLKEYIKLAEKDRIKFLQSPEGVKQFGDPSNPKTHLNLYEKLLPYAMLFGLEKEWSKQFAKYLTQAPDWYSGSSNVFTASALASSIGGLSTASSTAFTAPSSSGGSGFSGGGSGGGGGGGGGGGW